ncbi:MAG TPA: alpha-amylase family glycosyl hydrolase [Planctomycetota bacterium]|nr:alpha-amylase family glycosyl hydrolase [Planctomycetota bacterium]
MPVTPARVSVSVRRLLGAALLALGAGRLDAATHDNDIEWFGVYSDASWRSPEHPGKNQAFTVELHVFRGDVTGVRARTWTGSEQFHALSWNRAEGPYDVYRGTIAGTTSDYLYYYFEVTDGSDTDYFNALGMWEDAPPRGDFLVDTTPTGKHPLGATPTAAGTVFRVWAPNANNVHIAGSFNGWNASQFSMRANQGFWSALVPTAAPGDEYKFIIDGGIWRTDPRARRQVNSVGNSIVVDPGAYAWGDDGWVTPYFEDMVIYELHVGSFSGEGDGASSYPGRFRDVVDRHLDHLTALGVNVVEILPIGEFAGDQSWGYNPAFQFAPESAYGSADDFKRLVDECHRRGIAVILDVVYNHMGPGDLAGNLLDFDGKDVYFYSPASGYRDTPWGPRLDYGRVEVRDYIRDNVRYWLQEFHLDGFRVDATDFIKVNGDGWAVLQAIAQTADSVSPKAIVIAEQLPNDPAVTRPIAEGGAGLDAQWNDAFHDSLRSALGAAAFGDPDMTAVATGVNHFAVPTVVNYIESHDEAATGGRAPKVADPADPDSEWANGRSRVAAALVLFSAGIPMLLQGQEFLEDRKFGDARSDRIQWKYVVQHAGFLEFVRDAIDLRRHQPALRSSAGQNVFHVNDSPGVNVLALQRFAGADEDLIVVVSFANDDLPGYRLGFPAGGAWYEVLNGDSEAYGGRGRSNGGAVNADGGPLHGFQHSAAITIPRMGVLVFARQPLAAAGFLRSDCNGDGLTDLSDAVHALNALFLGREIGSCEAACDANSDGTIDISDPVFTLAFLFGGGAQPGSPWPLCGPAAGGLPCGGTCR